MCRVNETRHMQTFGVMLHGCFLKNIESENMKEAIVKCWFKWFRHGRRKRDCTVARVQSKVEGDCFSAWGDL